MVHEEGDETSDCELQLWLPVRLDNGGWVSVVRIDGIDMPPIAAMPGEDPLGALIAALAFARDVIDGRPGRVLFAIGSSAACPCSSIAAFRPPCWRTWKRRHCAWRPKQPNIYTLRTYGKGLA